MAQSTIKSVKLNSKKFRSHESAFMLFSAKIVLIMLWRQQRQEYTENIINICCHCHNLRKDKGKKKEKHFSNNKGYSNLVTKPRKYPAEQGLTSLGRP